MKKTRLSLVLIVTLVLSVVILKSEVYHLLFQPNYETIGSDDGTGALGIMVFEIKDKSTNAPIKDVSIKIGAKYSKSFIVKTNNRGVSFFIFYESPVGEWNLSIKKNDGNYTEINEKISSIRFRNKRRGFYLSESEIVSFVLKDRNNSISSRDFSKSGIDLEYFNVDLSRKGSENYFLNKVSNYVYEYGLYREEQKEADKNLMINRYSKLNLDDRDLILVEWRSPRGFSKVFVLDTGNINNISRIRFSMANGGIDYGLYLESWEKYTIVDNGLRVTGKDDRGRKTIINYVYYNEALWDKEYLDEIKRIIGD